MGNINLDQLNCLNLEKLRAKISKVTFPIADKRRFHNTGHWPGLDFTGHLCQLVNIF